MANKSQHELRWFQAALVERFSSVLYPIEVPELLRILPEAKWVVDERVFQEGLPQGRSPAAKGDLHLRINTESKTLGIVGLEATGIADAFLEFRRFWTERLLSGNEPETHYVEFIGRGFLLSPKEPLAAMHSLWGGLAIGEAVLKQFPTKLSLYGIRLSTPENPPNSPHWFDLKIDPSTTSPQAKYYVEVIWREPKATAVTDGLSTLGESITNLIRHIESKKA